MRRSSRQGPGFAGRPRHQQARSSGRAIALRNLGAITADPPSLFHRLKRYRPSTGRTPREDSLTEALAATLSAAPDATRLLVAHIFGDDGLLAGAPVITTQEHAGGLRRVDLAMRFGGDDHPPLRVWIEVKVDSRADRQQGESYIAHLETTGEDWRFGWLLTVGAEVAGGRPDLARVVTWQDVGSVLHAWTRAQPGDDTYAVGLVREFVRHLREEGLSINEPLTERDATALNWHGAAQLPASELVGQTRANLKNRWGEFSSLEEREQTVSRDPLWFWREYPKAPHDEWDDRGWPKTAWFEWHGRRDEAREHPEGRVVFAAGATFTVAEAPSADAPWTRRLIGERFEYGSAGARAAHVHLMRYWTLDDIVRWGASDVRAQADRLAGEIVATWQLLSEDPPPPDAAPTAGDVRP